ncbi:hypothetical protein ABW21_db0203830 [Orbilia brochopaga]|nr:hypothetical protein ABW21_db0203830 [Drechslerella brochopaga]
MHVLYIHTTYIHVPCRKMRNTNREYLLSGIWYVETLHFNRCYCNRQPSDPFFFYPSIPANALPSALILFSRRLSNPFFQSESFLSSCSRFSFHVDEYRPSQPCAF